MMHDWQALLDDCAHEDEKIGLWVLYTEALLWSLGQEKNISPQHTLLYWYTTLCPFFAEQFVKHLAEDEDGEDDADGETTPEDGREA